MFQAKNGKKFGSAFAGKNYDEKHVSGDESPAHEAKESPEFEAGEQEGKGEQEPTQVIAEHGNATSVHVHHDHKNNKHHVVSHHADGHMHTSDHATADEAQQHASQLGAQEAAPKNADAAGQENSPESDGFAMPSLGA
jgi:hypothetical protein